MVVSFGGVTVSREVRSAEGVVVRVLRPTDVDEPLSDSLSPDVFILGGGTNERGKDTCRGRLLEVLLFGRLLGRPYGIGLI